MKLAPLRAALSRLSFAAVLAVGIGAVAHAPATLAQTVPGTETVVPATTDPVAPAITPVPDTGAAAATAAPAPVPADATPVPAAPSTAPVDATATAAPSADDAAAQPAATAAPGAASPAAELPASELPAAGAISDTIPDSVPEGIPADALPHDLSPMGMYQQADIVVKAVMLGLIFASIVTWTVLIVKLVEYLAGMAAISRGANRIESAESLRAALAQANGRGPDARMLRAAAREMNRSAAGLSPEGVRDRIASHLSQIQARAARHMGRGTGVLATIGSTAPFVGLFGTVWGIMNSFIGISKAQTTNLAVVAPGIAEALLATAIGLIAAIPAVVIYNLFARAISGYRLRLGEAAAGVERLVSRDLDRAAAGMAV